LQAHLKEITAIFEEELGDRLDGIHLHGSCAMGGFNPASSDIDFLVVARSKPLKQEVARIAVKLSALRDRLPYPIECSLVHEASLKPFAYPTPVDFHYSDMHRERYRTDASYLCGDYEDYDFASQFVVAYRRGVPLFGTRLEERYEPVEGEIFLSSILHDVQNAAREIQGNPVYYVLNLCRVLHYASEGAVSSKKEGGEWYERIAEERYREMIRQALEEYAGGSGRTYDHALLFDFAGSMLCEIRRMTGREIDSSEDV